MGLDPTMNCMQIFSLRPPPRSIPARSQAGSSRAATQCRSGASENCAPLRFCDGAGLRGDRLNNRFRVEENLTHRRPLRTPGVANAGLRTPPSVAGKRSFYSQCCVSFGREILVT